MGLKQYKNAKYKTNYHFILYLWCHSDIKNQIQPLELHNVLLICVLQVVAEAALHNLGEGPQGMDVGKAIEPSFSREIFKLLLKNINFLQECSALITLKTQTNDN